jgi:quercetin dioxygenase-like cupin family protein
MTTEAIEMIEDPVFNYRIRFHPPEGEMLKMDVYVDPGGGVNVAHFHPATEERFEVVEGEATFTADGEEIVARAGDPVVVVAPGVRHTFRNSGRSEAHIVCQAEPAMSLQAFLTEAAALSRAGKFNRRGIPTGLRALAEAAEFADRHRETVVLTGGVMPPPRLQPLLLGPLARFQRRRSATTT